MLTERLRTPASRKSLVHGAFRAWTKQKKPGTWSSKKRIEKHTLLGTNISELWKRRIIFKSVLGWDMLVPGRVYNCSDHPPSFKTFNVLTLTLVVLKIKHPIPPSMDCPISAQKSLQVLSIKYQECMPTAWPRTYDPTPWKQKKHKPKGGYMCVHEVFLKKSCQSNQGSL